MSKILEENQSEKIRFAIYSKEYSAPKLPLEVNKKLRQISKVLGVSLIVNVSNTEKEFVENYVIRHEKKTLIALRIKSIRINKQSHIPLIRFSQSRKQVQDLTVRLREDLLGSWEDKEEKHIGSLIDRILKFIDRSWSMECDHYEDNKYSFIFESLEHRISIELDYEI